MAATVEAINEIFEAWANIYFSQQEKEEIASVHGAEALAAVLRIYDELMDTGRGAPGMDETFQRFGVAMATGYPWISQKARGNLFHALMMNWK